VLAVHALLVLAREDCISTILDPAAHGERRLLLVVDLVPELASARRQNGRRRRPAAHRRARRSHGARLDLGPRRLVLDAPALVVVERRERRACAVGLGAREEGKGRARRARRSLGVRGVVELEALGRRVGGRLRLLARRRLVLDDGVVEHERQRRAAAGRQRPVGRAHGRVAQLGALGVDVARAHIAHTRLAGRPRLVRRQRVADDGVAARRHARHDREARGRARQRLRLVDPRHIAHVAARRAVLDLDGLDLRRAAVDAHRHVAVVDGLASRCHGRQRLRHLERDDGRVAADEVRVRRAKKLVAVRDEEGAEAHVEAAQRVPDGLVDLDAHRELAAALGLDVVEREAVIGHANVGDGKGRVASLHKGIRLVAVDRVNVAERVVFLGVLELDRLGPLERQRHRLLLVERHLIGSAGYYDPSDGMRGLDGSIENARRGEFAICLFGKK